MALSEAYLKYAIASNLLGALVMGVVLRLVAPEQTVRLVGPMVVAMLALIGWYLLRIGRKRAALYVMAIGFWLAITCVALFNGGVRAPAVILYPVLLFSVGWLVGARGTLAAGGLTAVTVCAFAILEWQGVLPQAPPSALALFAVAQTIAVALVSLLIVYLINDYKKQLADLAVYGQTLATRTSDLESSQFELHRAQAVARVGSWVGDVADDAMRLSVEACRIIGVAEGTVLSLEGYLAKIHPDDRDSVREAWRAARKGAPYDHEHRIVDVSSLHWVRQRAVMEYSSDGTLLRALGITQDITDRKQAEAALRESESRYRTLVELTPQPILVHRSGTLLYVNAAAIELFGAPNESALLAKTTKELIHPDFRESQLARMNRINDAMERPAPTEARFLKFDGSVFDVEVQGTPIFYGGERAIQVAIHDISVLKSHQSQLEHMAHYDALTGLPNRVLLADRLLQAMAQAQRRGQMLAVAYLDLDGFKEVNDRYGHEVGDDLLIALSHGMKQTLRDGDTLARLGGDEFVAVLIDLADAGDGVPLLQRLLAAASQPVTHGNQELKVSASLGVTYYPQGEAVDADQLLRQADQAMYQAKMAGRNRIQVFDAEHDRTQRGYREDVQRVREALIKREFVLHYQPKVNMRTRTLVGAEALIRWQHPQKGLLAPAAFLPLIEDDPLAVDIGEWVIDTALTQMEIWRAEGLNLPVSVNLGGRQMLQAGFALRLRGILAAHPDIAPSQLELEGLEASALQDVTRAAQVIAACRDVGVETERHGDVLQQLGGDMAQGFGIARPMPGHEFHRWSVAWHCNPSWIDPYGPESP
jgi:diguanylate cyclase (GGDEF)-like protein/PAS domain S-box-containing protein